MAKMTPLEKLLNKVTSMGEEAALKGVKSPKLREAYDTHKLNNAGSSYSHGAYDQGSSLPVGESTGYTRSNVSSSLIGRSSSWKPGQKGPNDGFWAKAGAMGREMGANVMASGGGDGWGVAKMIGKHMAKGAVAGAGVEGTMEAAQGGSFWTGAKSGAFDGAVGWGAYRTLGKSVGATSRNPFGREGLIPKGKEMWSKQAKAIVNQKSGANAAAAYNGLNK